VHFDFTPDQQELRSLARKFLADTSPESAVHRVVDSDLGCDRDLWRRMGRELGLPGLAIPEGYGGAGQGLIEVGAVAEELGRTLACVPFLSSTMATLTLLAADDEPARQRYLPGLAAGDLVATVALTEQDGSWDPRAVTTSARMTTTGWRLDGRKSFVLDGHVADVILVVARVGARVQVFCIDANGPGVSRKQLNTLDRTRRQASVHLDDAPATLLTPGPDAAALIDGILDRAVAVLAAEQVGVAERALEISVEYAKIRHQFGRPIGSFQAIKHQLADVLLGVESARVAAYQALLQLGPASGERAGSAAASLAKAHCSEMCLAATERMIQIHGGIGFTWEHSAHLYFKRARSTAQLFGDAAHHRERLARAIGL